MPRRRCDAVVVMALLLQGGRGAAMGLGQATGRSGTKGLAESPDGTGDGTHGENLPGCRAVSEWVGVGVCRPRPWGRRLFRVSLPVRTLLPLCRSCLRGALHRAV